MESDERVLKRAFEDWCVIKITDPAKAPRSTALVEAYWTAFQAGWAKRAIHDRINLQVDDLELDRFSRQVKRAGTIVRLSPQEFSFLEILMLNAGNPVSKAEILAHAFGRTIGDDVVVVYCRQLRIKVDLPFERQLIQTVRGEGYQIG